MTADPFDFSLPTKHADLPLVISWFPTAIPKGPAIGDPERTTWGKFAGVFWYRREGEKDGPNFVPARFRLEPDGRHVRRLKANLIARTAVALDCETNTDTGEIPPPFGAAVERVWEAGWAALIYSSQNHRITAPRYRIVLPLSEEVAHELPSVEVVADRLRLAGVLDRSKVGPASLFYLPSANPGELDHHQTEVIDGNPIDAAWIRETAGAIRAEEELLAAEANAQAAARRQAKIAAGSDPDDSLIEKLRTHFDLRDVLLAHGYDQSGTKYRHPNSSSGSFGADIKVFGGIERVFSHNGTDPLHAENLPSWCTVAAVDAFDVVAILDYGGDRKKALADLAQRFGLAKTEERKALAALIFKLDRLRVSQEAIKAAVGAEGERLGLSTSEIVEVAKWAYAQAAA